MSIDAGTVQDQIATRVKAEREARGWSLADLAEKSSVSKPMLSKIERQEVSPTAVILVRIAFAFGKTLAELVSTATPERLLRAKDMPQWRDPVLNYVRRQIFLSPDNPMELVEVVVPPGAAATFPAISSRYVKQVVWVLEGQLDIREGDTPYVLYAGDRFEFGATSAREFRNASEKNCRYIIALLRL